MEEKRTLTIPEVLSEGIKIGVANIASLLLAVVLYVLTVWIPYLNVGTTIAMSTIPLKLSEGKVISPTFIFDAKYRQYMGEYFTLQGLMLMSLIPAFSFFFVPGIIISIGWSLALYIMLDRGIAPGEALIQSNKATYGHKWTIFAINVILSVAISIIVCLLAVIPKVGVVLMLLASIASIPFVLGCQAVIFKKLAKIA